MSIMSRWAITILIAIGLATMVVLAKINSLDPAGQCYSVYMHGKSAGQENTINAISTRALMPLTLLGMEAQLRQNMAEAGGDPDNALVWIEGSAPVNCASE